MTASTRAQLKSVPPQRTIGRGNNQRRVNGIAFGCMSLVGYRNLPDKEALGLLSHAADVGVQVFDAVNLHPRGEALLGQLKASRAPGSVLIGTKVGLIQADDQRMVEGNRKYLRGAVAESLKRIGDSGLDIIYLARPDPNVRITESLAALHQVVADGKASYVGASELTAQQLWQAHEAGVAPDILQVEGSLWSQGPLDIAELARETGTTVLAYAPLGRGLLTNVLPSSFELGDVRLKHPRFTGQDYEANRVQAARLTGLAAGLGVGPAALALAWVLNQGENVMPLFSSSRWHHIDEALEGAKLELDPALLAELKEIFPNRQGAGARYPSGDPHTADI